MTGWRGGDHGGAALGPPHNLRPLEVLIADRGKRHAIVELPSFEEAVKKGAAAYERDRETIAANFYQLARKVEDMRAALKAMGIPITED
jgi:hypothetical protein